MPPKDYRKCIACGKHPSYGYPGMKRTEARWCAKCAPDGAEDIVSKRCEGHRQGAPCTTTKPRFDYPEKKPTEARYCALCKKEGMVNVKSRKCECGAATDPRFGLAGEATKWCSKCPNKPPEAINKKLKKKKEKGRKGAFLYLAEPLGVGYFKFGVTSDIDQRRRDWGTYYCLYEYRLFECVDMKQALAAEKSYKIKAKREGISLGEETVLAGDERLPGDDRSYVDECVSFFTQEMRLAQTHAGSNEDP